MITAKGLEVKKAANGKIDYLSTPRG